ncbi:hypothetical protein LAJ59_21005, partial [Streptococcus pneumoniae]|nr:hypothetical protein [Streptococcus pneumoniae]
MSRVQKKIILKIKQLIMINANELRIGNWVLDNSQGKNEYYQLERFRDGQEVSDFCEPIPITVEIVNKLNCI